MTDRLRRVMANILNIPESALPENPSISTVANWDSLAQLRLVMAIEEEFKIRFPSDSIMEMTSLSAFKTALEKLSQ